MSDTKYTKTAAAAATVDAILDPFRSGSKSLRYVTTLGPPSVRVPLPMTKGAKRALDEKSTQAKNERRREENGMDAKTSLLCELRRWHRNGQVAGRSLD